MSRQKEKKIKKLHKKHIWPAIVVTFLFLLAFGCISFFMFGLTIEGLLSQKMDAAQKNAQRVALYIAGEQVKGEEDLTKLLAEIQKILPEVKELNIVDENGETLMQTGTDRPNLWNEFGFIDGENDFVYFSENKENALYIEDGDIKINYNKMLSSLTDQNNMEDLDGTIFRCCIWVGADVEQGNMVLLKNEITVKELEVAIIAVFGAVVFLLLFFFAVYYIAFIIGLIRDQRRLTGLLYLEPETGGKNWNYLKAKGRKKIAKGFRTHENYALVHIRMNRFRSFCVCYGAKEGLELLEILYAVLQRNLRKNEIGVHYARADFALLMQYKEKEELEQRIKGLFEKMGAVRQGQRLCFCAGIYEIKDKKVDMDEMYNNASTATSALREDSDQCIRWYGEEMHEQQMWERKVEDTMEEALERKEFKVYLQPKYSPKEETLSGAEALVRWISPEEGFIPPNRFIPIFEKNGFILKLDDYMILEVARQQAEWISQGKKVVPISVNVSRAHFMKEDLADHICALVDRYQVPHEVIELELTESAFFQDKEVLLRTVRTLREYGFTVSMDDFGSGYSSLNSLKELPLDVIKLDAEFFREIEDAGKGKIIVNEAICLAKKLDMKIVAEGIETKEQVNFLKELDCDLIQGFYFAKPMPVDEFEEKAFS